jgi:glycerol uptake facilitator-like aquaporin
MRLLANALSALLWEFRGIGALLFGAFAALPRRLTTARRGVAHIVIILLVIIIVLLVLIFLSL